MLARIEQIQLVELRSYNVKTWSTPKCMCGNNLNAYHLLTACAWTEEWALEAFSLLFVDPSVRKLRTTTKRRLLALALMNIDDLTVKP